MLSASSVLFAIGVPSYFLSVVLSVFLTCFLAVFFGSVAFLVGLGFGFISFIIRTYPIDSKYFAVFSDSTIVEPIGLRSMTAPTVSTLYFFVIYSRSEEHTSELQSRGHLVCRLLLEKKN